MNIKHIVLSGGGAVGLVEYGILKTLSINKVIDYDKIKSVYATSIGGFIGLIYILNFDWQWMDDYIIKRPWQKIVNINSLNLLNIFNTKGFLDEKFILDIIKPLLLAKDLNIDITLKELYDYTNKDLYLFTTNLNKFSKVSISHYSHPDLRLNDALHMTCCVPILVKPPYYNNDLYLDGGLFANIPVNECLINENTCEEEILTLVNDKKYPIDLSNNYYIVNNYNFSNNNVIDNNSNIITYLIYIIRTIIHNFSSIETEHLSKIKNCINVSLTYYTVDINYWIYVFNNSNERKYLIELGHNQANKFIKDNIINNIDISNNSINFIDNSINIIDNSNYLIY